MISSGLKGPLEINRALGETLRQRDERLAALKHLAGKLAHDFNNRLVPLLGYASLIREEVGAESGAAKYVSILEETARGTETYLEKVLGTVRPQRRFVPQPTDFTRLLQEELSRWQTSLPATVPIQVVSTLSPCSLKLDAALWRLGIQELLANARFALASGGQLEVELQPLEFSNEACQALHFASTKAWQLRIRDYGMGMPETVVCRACDPFFTTRSKGQGIGLGLTAVHSIVQLHQGQLWIESKEAEGTAVVIWLPEGGLETHAMPPVAMAAPVAQPKPGCRKILFVEDDAMVREVVRCYFEKWGWDYCLAKDGMEGLELFQKHREEIAFVISDIHMPRMDGVELYKKLLEIAPEMRVMLISGDAGAVREESFIRQGLKPPMLVKKPFNLKFFIEELRTIIPGVSQ